MKYPLLSAMPSWGVSGWLDEQLEARGIDPVVYTRYVLSLLRRDGHSDKGPSKRVRREDCESVRRAAAVECLMSASDQQVGMETLVDELCIKLQDISSLAGSPPHCDWPLLAAAPLATGAVLDEAPPPSGWDDDDARGWPRRLYQRQCDAETEDDGDPSLARLMAKFDQSIEALWSPGPEPELPADEPATFDFALPTSPPGSKSHVFIPNGTNITSSIWSDCGDEEAVLARNGELDGAWPEPEGAGTAGAWLGDLEGLGARTEEVDCSGAWAEPEGPGAWSGELENAGPGTWSGDLEGLGARAGEIDCSGAWAEPEDPGAWAPSWAAALLNHSKQESSFTEVVPKPHEDPLPLEAARPPDVRLAEVPEAPEPSEGDLELQEDLLTSARTHFKPIRSEAAEAGGEAGGVGYADGTTFVIAAGLEVLAFRRCQSGTLLLESDQVEPAAKYREYKEKEPYAGRYCRDADLGDEVSEFVPKFRVSVNEKCCQTEPALLPTETETEYLLPMETERDTDLFFPGDADAWDNCAGVAALAEERPLPRHGAWDDLDCGCRAPEGLGPWEQTGGWAQAGLAGTIWQAPCGLCWDAGRARSGDTGGGAAPRLREELSRDGDQLLSDLSYVFLGSDWLTDVDAPATDASSWDADDQDDDYGGAPSAGKLQCLSPVDADTDADVDRAALRQHARSVDAFLSSCLLSALPSTLLLSASACTTQRTPWRGHSERKRRHSMCQRSVPEPPGYVRRPPCALVSHSLRPVTL